jgi:hypothetical protein
LIRFVQAGSAYFTFRKIDCQSLLFVAVAEAFCHPPRSILDCEMFVISVLLRSSVIACDDEIHMNKYSESTKEDQRIRERCWRMIFLCL